jgi:AcrR family transcriptional regulator
MTRRLPASERRAQLIETSISVFSAQGYTATTMDAIAEEAGVTKPVLYQHFESKHELFLTLMTDIGERLTDQVVASVLKATTPYERVSFGIKSFFSFMADHTEDFQLVFGEGFRAENDFLEIVERFENLMAEAIANLTDIPDRSLEARLLMARGVVGMVEATGKYWLLNPGGLDLNEVTEYATDLVWLGLRGRPPVGN